MAVSGDSRMPRFYAAVGGDRVDAHRLAASSTRANFSVDIIAGIIRAPLPRSSGTSRAFFRRKSSIGTRSQVFDSCAV